MVINSEAQSRRTRRAATAPILRAEILAQLVASPIVEKAITESRQAELFFGLRN